MKNIRYIFIIVVFLSAELSFSAEIETQVLLRIEGATSLKEHSKRGNKNRTSIMPKIEMYFKNSFKLTSLVKISHENESELKPSTLNKNGYTSISRPLYSGNSSTLELRELYVEKTLGNSFITLGKQQVVWGKADGLKVLDAINPQSYNEFILEDYESSRIPLWMLNVEFSLGDNDDLQVLWVVDTSTHVLPGSNASFAFTSPRLVPNAPENINIEVNDIKAPALNLKNSDFGLRWSSFKAGWDLSINYLYHYDDLPVFFQTLETVENGTKIVINPQYKRSHLIGGSFSNTFGNFTLRGEAAYVTDRRFLLNNHNSGFNIRHTQGVTKQNEFAYVIGVDWHGLSETLISLQLFESHILNTKVKLTRPKHDTALTFLAQKEFYNNTLKAEVLVLYNLNDKDSLIRPKLSYNWSDSIRLWLSADVFAGHSEGLFGQFSQNNRISIGLETAL